MSPPGLIIRQDTITTEASVDEINAEDFVEEVRVLEFQLGPGTYCVDIEYVSEIADKGQLTVVPNVPNYVEDVMDLRERTTSTINPKSFPNIDVGGESERIVIFDPNKFEGEVATDWLADEVYQVMRVSMDDVEDPPLEKDDSIEGVIKHDGDLVVWISPVHAIEQGGSTIGPALVFETLIGE